MIDVPFRPDRSSREPVYRQLAACLRGLIETGRLGGGQKLPASRELAASLGLSRTTVAQAYDDLVAAGLLNAHVGQGTFVALHLAPHPTRPLAGRAFVWAGLFSARARALGLPAGLIGAPQPRYDFRGGRVDGASLPAAALRRALADAVGARLEEIAAQEDPYGWAPLRRQVARYLVARGIRCEPDEVAIVNGAQHAIDLTARVLLDPGDTAVIEQPGYFGAAMVLAAAQANVVGVGVDEEGLRTDELARVLQARRVKLIYTTPAVQNPTGVTLSDARRSELLALVDHHQAPLLEDDYASELRYGEPPIAALKTSDAGGQVIYVGTFSKVLFPTLRVGFVVAAKPLLRKMVLARMAGDFATSMPAQVAVAEMLRSGALDRHVRRVRRLYGRRLRALVTALSCTMPEGVRWTEPRGGHILWLTLPAAGDAVFRDASAAGIAYSSGTAFHVDGQGADHIALSFACMPSARIAEGVEKLAAIVRRHLASTGRSRRGASRGQRSIGARRA
jgi:GntR family transcriptional regulator/MocR family aminotransferase